MGACCCCCCCCACCCRSACHMRVAITIREATNCCSITPYLPTAMSKPHNVRTRSSTAAGSTWGSVSPTPGAPELLTVERRLPDRVSASDSCPSTILCSRSSSVRSVSLPSRNSGTSPTRLRLRRMLLSMEATTARSPAANTSSTFTNRLDSSVASARVELALCTLRLTMSNCAMLATELLLSRASMATCWEVAFTRSCMPWMSPCSLYISCTAKGILRRAWLLLSCKLASISSADSCKRISISDRNLSRVSSLLPRFWAHSLFTQPTTSKSSFPNSATLAIGYFTTIYFNCFPFYFGLDRVLC
mmetsp:Transcript_20059/g.55840  ORF Transcript_20059/g.55840 Transcript_20059/m.55840 type:complete len:304 (-) Transcript_20059:1813-2724(-)